MKYTYDPVSDALYIEISSAAVDHTLELADGVIADVNQDGSLVGIDVMVPSHGWDVAAVAARFGLEPATAKFLEDLAAVRWMSSLRPADANSARNVTAYSEELVTTSA